MAKKFRKAWLMHTLPPSLLARHSSDHDSRGRRDNGGERERERWELRSRPRPRSCATFCRSRPPTRHRLLWSQIWALRRRAPTTSTNVELMAKGIASESFLDLTDPSKTQDAETQLEAMMTIAKNTNAMQDNFKEGTRVSIVHILFAKARVLNESVLAHLVNQNLLLTGI